MMGVSPGLSRRSAALGAGLLGLAVSAARAAEGGPVRGQGVMVWRSGVGFGSTVERLQQDVKSKGIPLFDVIDQAKLAADAGITERDAAFSMATKVVASIVASVGASPA